MQAVNANPIVCPQPYRPDSMIPQSDATPSDYTSVAQLYSAMRLFGTPAATRIAAGQSDQTPLTRQLGTDGTIKLAPGNYTNTEAVMTGRYDTDLDKGGMRTASYSIPRSENAFRGPVRAEQYIGTASSRTEYGEIISQRPNTASYQPSMMNLTPVNANAECRAKEVVRLNKLNDAYVAARLKSAI